MHAKFGIVSFRTESLALSGAEWVEKSLSISSCGSRLQFLGLSATRCSENSDPAMAGHFSRHDRATQHGNISHLVANEVQAFAGERGGSLAVSRKPPLLEVLGEALNRHNGPSASSRRLIQGRRFGNRRSLLSVNSHVVPKQRPRKQPEARE